MTHIHFFSVGHGGDAALKAKEGPDGRWSLLITDGDGTVLRRAPADGFATREAALSHGEKLAGAFWHPMR